MNMATLRTWHFYIGMFIAPTVLFFAITGALQLFSWHEAHGNYTPPPILEKLSSVHKDQVFAAGHHHEHAPPKAAGPSARHDDDDDKKMKGSTLALKAFFFWGTAFGLILSTLLGLWIGLTHPLRRRRAWIAVIAGAAIPIILLLV